MDISSLTGNRRLDSVRSLSDGQNEMARGLTQAADKGNQPELRKAFDSFVGETFYGQMLEAMRKTQNKPAYFHGGQAEEMFREQLDQTLAQKMSEKSASSFTGSMFDLFELNRK
jgi:Rod binding domain-containing protein